MLSCISLLRRTECGASSIYGRGEFIRMVRAMLELRAQLRCFARIGAGRYVVK